MTRKPWLTLAVASTLAIAGLGLTGCSSSSPKPGGEAAGGSVAGTTLVVYSPQGAGGRGNYITSHAKADLGITVKFVSGGGGDLAHRLIAEKNNSQADVVLGLGEAQMSQVGAAGVLQPYIPAWYDLIPKAFQSDNHDFTLFSQTPIVVSYNTAKMSAGTAPKSWEDLAGPQYKNKFVFPPVSGQTGQAAMAGILWRYTDPKTGQVSAEGWDVLTKILKNALPVSAGQKFDWNDVVTGKLPIVVSWLGDIQTGSQDNKLDMKVVNTTGGTPFVSGGIGLTNGTKNAAAAKKFVDWFGSANFQAGFVKATNNDTPTNTNAVKQLPGAEAALMQVTKQNIDWGVAAHQLTSWLQRVQLDVLG